MIKSWLSFLTAALITANAGAADLPAITLYKTPECECCEGHAEHLRSQGFVVTTVSKPDLHAFKDEVGIPEPLHGCHTSVVAGYIVEGHVPAGIVKQLLSKNPPILGISLPGMPDGSPGMTGRKIAPFEIFEINFGRPKLFARD